MKKRIYVVNAFADSIFSGNTAGVVILDEFLDEKTMRSIAAELRYSETAFVKKLDKKRFKTRYFTPNEEVDMCGHATLAVFFALKDFGTIDKGEYINITKSGELSVVISEDEVFAELPEARTVRELSMQEIKELSDIMRISSDDILSKPRIISSGLDDIQLLVSSKDVLLSIDNDNDRLSDFSKKLGVVGLHAFCIEGKEVNARNFAPLYAIDEEPATGTSNGGLFHYMVEYLEYKKDRVSVFQGESMNRRSKIVVLKKDSKTYVGGSVKLLARGELSSEIQ